MSADGRLLVGIAVFTYLVITYLIIITETVIADVFHKVEWIFFMILIFLFMLISQSVLQ